MADTQAFLSPAKGWTVTEPIKSRLAQALRLVLGRPLQKPALREVPAITLEEVAEARRFFPMDKFFIFGHARAGTTVYVRLIRLHPEVHCNYQAHFFTRSPTLESLVADSEVTAWLKRDSNRWNRGSDLSPVILRAAADMIMEREACRANKRIVGDKSPNNTLDGKAVRNLHKVYPEARLIYVLRDGRDTVLSHRFQAFIDFPERLSGEDLRIRAAFSENPQPFLNGERSIFTDRGILAAAQGWIRNVTETCSTAAELYGERFLVSRYEDLLAQPWQEMVRLWGFLSTTQTPASLEQSVIAELQRNPDADWQQVKARSIAEAVQKGKQGTWRHMFTERDRRVFQQVAGELLEKSGYQVA